MKRTWFIGFLTLVFLVACNSNKQVPEPVEGPSKELSAIDSLLWQQPDSALAVLKDYLSCRDGACTVSTNPCDRHYVNLFLAELLYKNDYAQTNRHGLQQAVAYYDSLLLADVCNASLRGFCRRDTQRVSAKMRPSVPFLAARAHYINGVGYYENDSVVEACKEYLKALEVMEEHFEEKELVGKKSKFMALTYSHLTSLFSDMYLHEQVIYFGKKSLKYYHKHNAEPWHIAWTLNQIGGGYHVLSNYDSAYYYCNQGLNILSDTNSLMYRDIATGLALLSYKKEGTVIESLNRLKVILSNVNSDKEYYSRCSSIGGIYYLDQQFDSAWFYYNKVFENTQREDSKKLAAQRLVEICKAQGKESEAMEYADFLVPFATMEENQSVITSQLIEQYKNYGQRKQEREYQQDKMKSQRWTMIIAGSLLVLILFTVILYRRNRKRKQHLETQIAAERQAHQIQQDALSGKLKQKNQEVRELQDQIKQQNDRDAETETTISFNEEPICRLITERVKEGQFKSQMDCSLYKSYALTKEQIMALHEAVNRHFAGFTMRLKKAYPQLTDSDLNYCSLYLLGLTDADIAALMQKAYPTVSQRSRKLKTIFGSETSLPITLYNIANNNSSY